MGKQKGEGYGETDLAEEKETMDSFPFSLSFLCLTVGAPYSALGIACLLSPGSYPSSQMQVKRKSKRAFYHF